MTIVYLINQTQPSSEYYDKTIYVLSSRTQAEKYARTLNKKYGDNCEFSKEGDFIDTSDYECSHYYTVECIELDEKLA